MQTSAERVQLLVVGGGPVGLVAGLTAVRAGLEVAVVDQSFRSLSRGYATLLHGRTLELLAELGVRDRLLEAGRMISRLVLRIDDEEPLLLELPTPVLAVAQGRLEEALLQALRDEAVDLRAPYQATAIQQDAAGVRVRLVQRELTEGGPAQEPTWEPVSSSTIEARFLVGADGYDSGVRAALGIEAVKVGELETFAMFEVANDPGPELQIAFQQGLANVVVPLAEGRARLGFQVDRDLDAAPDSRRLRELSGERARFLPTQAERVEWSSVIHFERRLCRRFGSGRVWLAGDAAHVTSPLGAHSMNLGMHEAFDLVRRVANCEREPTRLDTLEQYGAERQREWHKLLGFHVKYEVLPRAPAWLPSYARKIAPVLPASGAELRLLLDRLGLRVG